MATSSPGVSDHVFEGPGMQRKLKEMEEEKKLISCNQQFLDSKWRYSENKPVHRLHTKAIVLLALSEYSYMLMANYCSLQTSAVNVTVAL